MSDDHMDIWKHETAMLAPTSFERWIVMVEELLGHDSDGCGVDHDHSGHEHDGVGYSLDDFSDRFDAGQTPGDAVREVRASAAYRAPGH